MALRPLSGGSLSHAGNQPDGGKLNVHNWQPQEDVLMGKPVAVAKNIAFAFPNICNTTIPPAGPVPLPYPNIAQLADAKPLSDSNGDLLVKGTKVLVEDSEVDSSSGDEAADPNSGVSSGKR